MSNLLWVCARCMVKVALRHTYIVLCMRRVVRHMHDVCTQYTLDGTECAWLSKVACGEIVRTVGLSVTVKVRVQAGDRE